MATVAYYLFVNARNKFDFAVTNKRDLSSNVSTALRAIAQLLSPQSVSN